MKNVLFLLSLIALISVSCSKDDDKGVKLLTEADVIPTLESSDFGWVARYAGKSKEFGGSNFLLKFKNDQLYIKTDYNDKKYKEQITSDYTFESKVLTMGEASIFAKLFNADPESANNPMYDYQFEMKKVEADKIEFVGKTFKTKLTLIKATEADKNVTTHFDKQSKNLKKFGKSNKENKFFKVLKLTGAAEKLIDINFEYWDKTIDWSIVNVKYLDGENVVSETIQYVYTEKGLLFLQPIVINEKKIANFVYEDGKYLLDENNGVKGEISFSNERPIPIKGIGKELMGKMNQMCVMTNSELAEKYLIEGATCQILYSKYEVGVAHNLEREGKIENFIMLSNKRGSGNDVALTIDMKWEIEGEDVFKGTVKEMDKYNKLNAGQKKLCDLFINGFYITPYNDIMGMETYILVAKENSSISMGAFILKTK